MSKGSDASLCQVFGCILVTLVYFQLLQAVKESDFLNATSEQGSSVASSIRNRVSTVRKPSGKDRWISVNSGNSGETQEVYLQQVILSLDTRHAAPTASKSLQNSPELLSDVKIVDAALRHHFELSDTKLLFDPDLCFQSPSTASCVHLTFENSTHASSYFPSARKTVITYAFSSEARNAAEEWVEGLQDPLLLAELNKYISSQTKSNVELRLPSSSRPATSEQLDNTGNLSTLPKAQSGLGLSLPLSPKAGYSSYREGSARDLSGIAWFMYAVKTFVLRFWTLAKVRTSSTCWFPADLSHRQ